MIPAAQPEEKHLPDFQVSQVGVQLLFGHHADSLRVR